MFFYAKVFLPLAAPGLASLGIGMLATAQGAYSILELAAIVVGLVVVAVAGLFTIRSNVAKVWREQAEGEKARADGLAADLAEAIKQHAEAQATMRLAHAGDIAKMQHDIEEQRRVVEQLQADLASANARTDLSALTETIREYHRELLAALAPSTSPAPA